VIVRNPNFHGETYPCEGEPGDKEKGYLDDCGKNIPFVDKVVFDLEKEGVPLQAKPVPASPGLLVLSLLFFALVLFLAVRFIMAGAVASAEQAGPIAILKRSWNLTSGHFWPLFGFIVVYLIAAVVVLLAVVSATGALVGLFIGSVQPLSTGALILALVQAVVSAAVSTLFFVMIARIYAQLAGRDAQVSVRSSGT